MSKPRRHLPVVHADDRYEANYAVRRAMVDEDRAHLEAAIAACGPGADEYARHIVHDKLGLEPERSIYCRRDGGVWSPPSPDCDERILRESALVTTSGGVQYMARAVTIPAGRFAEYAETRFARRYDVSTSRFSMADYRPRTPEQLKAAAEARRAKALAQTEAKERAEAEARANAPQLGLPLGVP